MSKDCTEFSVPARLDALPGLLAWLDGATGGLAGGMRQRLRIVTEELFLNTVHHGRSETDLPVTLALRREDGQITLTYRDAAAPFNPSAATPRDPNSPAIGGFGLDLIRHLANDMQYKREQFTNRIDLMFSLRQDD